MLDSELRTLPIRGGHDLRKSLNEAGFRGYWYVDSYPYLEGPVRDGLGCLEQRARGYTATPGPARRGLASIRAAFCFYRP